MLGAKIAEVETTAASQASQEGEEVSRTLRVLINLPVRGAGVSSPGAVQESAEEFSDLVCVGRDGATGISGSGCAAIGVSVRPQLFGRGELLVTVFAGMLRWVGLGMRLEVVGGREGLATAVNGALVGPLSCVLALVLAKVTACREMLAALVVLTVECLASVQALVCRQAIEGGEGTVAALLLTVVWFLPRVDSSVDLEAVGGEEGLVAPVHVALVGQTTLVTLHVRLEVAHARVGAFTAIIDAVIPLPGHV